MLSWAGAVAEAMVGVGFETAPLAFALDLGRPTSQAADAMTARTGLVDMRRDVVGAMVFSLVQARLS